MGNLQELKEAICRVAEEAFSPADVPYNKLSCHGARRIAEHFSIKLKEVEISALQNDIIPERYQRSLGTIGGPEGQIKLLESRVAVIGLGGLGGLSAELLARMGIGTLVLVDGDSFSESNLNRQILSTEKNLGQRKAFAANRYVGEINRAVETIVVDDYLTSENAEEILQGSELILDCLDNLSARFLLQKACRQLRIPMIHGAIAQFYGQITTIFPEDPGLEFVYGNYNRDKGIEVELGNPATTPAIVAAWQVQEALKVLLGNKPLLRNKLLFIDTLAGNCESIPLLSQGVKEIFNNKGE